MSKVYSERPPQYRGPSKIPRFYNNSAALPPVDMSSGGQRNPSKLQQLQSNYQQRLMKEKEEKLIKMYEDNQRRALQKVNSQSKMTVRDFFKERRQMEQNVDNAHALPSMNTHYKIKRMDVQSDTDDPWVHRQNSNGSLKYSKIAKGRDKSNPLAPIDRNRGQNSMIPAPVPQKPQRHGRPWTLKETTPKNTTPVSNGHIPRSAPSNGFHGDENFPAGQMTPSDDTPPPNLSSLKTLQKQKRHQYNGTSSKPPSGVSRPQKKSDFQNWQMEQDKAREERLKKAGMKPAPAPAPAYEYEETDEEENTTEDDMAKQQRELMARIQQQQRELEGMRKQREREEEQEKKEMERRRKREEERRRRMKEEEEQRLRDEAERRIREEEERERQQQNQYSHREDYSARNKPTRRFSPKSMYEDDMSSYKTQPTPPPPQTKPVRVQRKAVKPHPPPPQPPPPREQSPALPAPSNQDLSFFLAAANDPEAHASGRTNLVSCSNCGRKFDSDRIQKHKAACGNVTKKRKVHDPSKMRVAGTDMEKYYSSSKKQKPQPPPKKSNWRTKHESFIQTIRYAKKVSEMEKTGVSTSALPPPPPSDTSDYVQCPWCSRKFNPSTAERHIPRCKDIKSRPAPPRRR